MEPGITTPVDFFHCVEMTFDYHEYQWVMYEYSDAIIGCEDGSGHVPPSQRERQLGGFCGGA